MKTSLPVTTLEVRTLPFRKLKPAPYNPRQVLKPGDPAYQRLEASLREFGLVEPLIWNELTGHVVGGHARLRILKALGIKQVAVSVVRLDAAREKALNIVLNNQEAQARYDTDKLADLLEELQELPEFDLTGFEHSVLRTLRMEPGELANLKEDPTGRVTVSLEMDAGTYENVAPRLDAIIGEFDLTSHVQRR
jgi:ParB-like chromosome segregation protein Spo0J